MKITVKIYENGEEILKKVLGEGSHRAGRSEFCDIVLKGDQISRSHVELRVTDANVYMTNMSSPGRVKVNNERVETAEIKDGDEIQLGQYRVFVFHGEEGAEAVVENQAPASLLEPAPPEPEPQPAPNKTELLPQREMKADVIPMPLPLNAVVEEYPVEGTAALQKAETVIEPKPIVARLIFTDGAKAGDELPLEAYEVTFGRSKKADVFLDDVKLSRKHCKIARVGMGYRLIDLGSRNGTFVNGMRVLEHPLSSFDVIEIGDTKMKFLIVDLALGDVQKGALATISDASQARITRSMALEEGQEGVGAELEQVEPNAPPTPREFIPYPQPEARSKTVIYAAAIALLVALYYLIPEGGQKKGSEPTAPTANVEGKATETVGNMPKEYTDLSKDMQRAVEGHYNTAVKAGTEGRYEEAVIHLKAIHDSLPFYKNSRDLLEQFSIKLREKQAQAAKEEAEKNQKADLALYLEDGVEYLKEGDFGRAAEAFNAAILLDPKNETALKGLRAADLKIKDLSQVPPEMDPEEEKKKQVGDLYQKAVAALINKEYQKAIDFAEGIRKIEIKGDTQYLNEAKQVIDRAKQSQKEEFEPFLLEAKSKFAEGDYTGCRDLVEEMLKRDPAYEDAKELLAKAKKMLNRLAKEAYTYGYILESMNRIEEAKQYWNRAKNYVRPGDEYYDKIMKKLDHYQ